ncbi:hypothetical protein F4775DRAFT_306385 [Biscogniauxia sp. FL1348]|nr:hypothetical protein F4775DRAFT_306385 [Biscogniauxia sp. FL1348]
MAPIGPQLPPHLAKRKRTPDDEPSTVDSPPSKLHASERGRINQDEVDIESGNESDDDYGPSAPIPTSKPSIGPSVPPPPTTQPSIGPTLPPTNTDEIALDSDGDDQDDIGPAPIPPPTTAPEPKRVHGPAPPPASLSERPSSPPNAPGRDSDSDSDDSDDGYGPALPTSNSHIQRQARAQEAAAYEAAQSSAPKRDDWMLAPPTAGSSRAPDPTKLKARKFNSGPRAAASSSNSGGAAGEISSIWTETPEQKRKRLENAVLGRDTGGGGGGGSGSNGRSAPRPYSADKGGTEQQQARIQNFTEATRGRSLYEEHQRQRQRDRENGGASRGGKAFEEEDDPSKRAFDKEKDMKLGGPIGATQRRELLRKAADFGDRFAKGKYL